MSPIQSHFVANTIAFQRIEPAPASRIRCLSDANARNTPLMRRVDQMPELYPPSSCGTHERGRESDGEQDVHRLTSPDAYQCGSEERIHERASLRATPRIIDER